MSPLVRRALATLERFFATVENPYVACSFGKDSIAVLWLVQQVRPETPVVWFDGGKFDEWPETYPFIDEVRERWAFDLLTVRPEVPLIEQWRRYGIPDARHTTEEGIYTRQFIGAFKRAAKEHGFDGDLLGMRADESLNRRGLLLSRGPIYHVKRQGLTRCCPIWDWSIRDVWAVIYRYQLPIHPLYRSGLQPIYVRGGHGMEQARLGCMAETCFASSGALARFRRMHPSLFNELAAEFPELRRDA